MSQLIDRDTARRVLDLPLEANDSGTYTVRGYLIALLRTVWDEAEGFSGKRPFGNSGWEYDLYKGLGQAGLVEMTFDEDGYVEVFNRDQRQKGDALIDAAIQLLGEP